MSADGNLLASFIASLSGRPDTAGAPSGLRSPPRSRRIWVKSLLVVVRADDLIAFKLCERHEWDDPAAVDVGPRDRHLAVRPFRLDDLEHALRARRPDRNDHDSAGLQLLQQRRGNVVDAAGDDDLVEGRGILPPVIAVGGLAFDDPEFRVAVLDELVVDRAGAVRQGLDDLDRVYLVSQ